MIASLPPSPDSIVAALSAAGDCEDAELIITQEERLHLELEPATGQWIESRGAQTEVHASVLRGDRVSRASVTFESEASLTEALRRARAAEAVPDAVAWARRLPSREDGAGSGEPAPDLPRNAPTPDDPSNALAPDRLRSALAPLIAALVLSARPVQAMFARQLVRTTSLHRRSGARASWTNGLEDVLIRIETARGAVVEGMGAPLSRGLGDPAPLLRRLELACEALEAESRGALDLALPALVSPAIVTQWLAALAPLLRADIAAQSLGPHLGKKLFASCVTLADDPLHREATTAISRDDAGSPTAAATLVQQGKLTGFLHALPTLPEGSSGAPARAFRHGGAGVVPGWTNLHLVPSPGSLPLPPDRLEVCARVETFSPRPRAGRVELLVAGWIVRGGERRQAFGPVPLEGSALQLLRKVQAVGQDLTFVPIADGCGSPSVLVASLV